MRRTVGMAPDALLRTARSSGLLPDLVRTVGGEASRVLSISDFTGEDFGVGTIGREPNIALHYDVLDRRAAWAAAGRFTHPISQGLPIARWRAVVEADLSGRPHGELLPTL